MKSRQKRMEMEWDDAISGE